MTRQMSSLSSPIRRRLPALGSTGRRLTPRRDRELQTLRLQSNAAELVLLRLNPHQTCHRTSGPLGAQHKHKQGRHRQVRPML